MRGEGVAQLGREVRLEGCHRDRGAARAERLLVSGL
jgi:hypothetical protein